MEKITVQWIGHACYKLTFGDWSCVIDPYENGSVPGLNDVQATAHRVFCSHGHHDHNAEHLVKQMRSFAPAPQVTEVSSFHDEVKGAKRGENTIHLFEYRGMKLAHFGDLGHLLDSEQTDRIGTADIVLIPVGGFYTIDCLTAKAVAEQVNAKIIIPMHYRTEDFGFDVISHIDEFTALFDNVTKSESDSVEICPQTPAQVIVLTPAALK